MIAPIEPTVVWLTFRQLFVRRRLIAASIFSLIPLVVALAFRASHGPDDPRTLDFFVTLYREIVVGTLLPLAAVVFGTTAFGGEIDDGTLVYLLVKPVARWRVVLSKYLVAAISTAAVMLPTIVLPWLALATGAVPRALPIGFAAGVGAGALLYCALFVALGLASRRALVVGLLYIVVLEFVLSRQIAGVRSLSVREFALTVTDRVAASAPALVHDLVHAVVPMTTVWTMGAIMLAGALLLAIRKLGRFELAERL